MNRVYLFLLVSFYNSNLVISQNDIITSNRILIKEIMEDNFSPPVASRIHLYANLTSYEIICQKNQNYKSISSFTNFPKLKSPSKNINYSIASISGFCKSGLNYIFNEQELGEYYNAKIALWKKSLDTNLVNESIQYGEYVAKEMLDWSKSDNYGYTRTLHRYELSDTPGSWIQTPPEYHNGLEPNWRLMRQIVLPNDSFLLFAPNVVYSEDKSTLYYLNAYSLSKKSLTLTQNEKDIAFYWDDNPMTSISKGHVMYVIKKPTPIGHWLKIASSELVKYKINLEESSLLYTMVSIAAYDGIINCWNVKYKSNSVRPETYIQRIIDPNFRPLIETPPFPEYTSGHSTISSAVATVLTNFFPKSKGFIDSSQISLGMKSRKFKSYLSAAKEASISRFYGGIHYMPALLEGERMGKLIGKSTWNRFIK